MEVELLWAGRPAAIAADAHSHFRGSTDAPS